LTCLLSEQRAPSLEELFHILANRTIPDDASLPHTGVELEWERILSPIFIVSPTYGTRSSTVLLIDMQDRVTFVEKTFNSDLDHPTSVEYKFKVDRLLPKQKSQTNLGEVEDKRCQLFEP
ncbi:MAG: hypothetical protein GQ555_07865, partial [Desulfobacterales bacterium]|nr:hypothetical protein [Desulfobacterales bacterium]